MDFQSAQPQTKLPLLIDTDTFNEIDDQFALVYAFVNQDIFDLKAVVAAPYFHERVSTPLEGMMNSYGEIVNIFDLYGQDAEGLIFKGADRFMESCDDVVKSEGVEKLIELALAQEDGPLYVVAIAAATNIASAIKLCPAIIDKIRVVWLGGQPYSESSAKEFNLRQDVGAAQVLFDSGVDLVHVPCREVAQALTTTKSELAAGLEDCSRIGDYLLSLFSNYVDERKIEEKTIWDVATIAYLVNKDWVKTEVAASPVLMDDMSWGQKDGRHDIVVATHVDREKVFSDFFRKLKLAMSKKCSIETEMVKSEGCLETVV